MKNKIFFIVVMLSFLFTGLALAQDENTELIPPDEQPQQEEQAIIPPLNQPQAAGQLMPLQPQPVAISKPTDANKISLDIKGMDVVDVLKMLAQRAGMNIVIGKNVTGRVTLFLKDVDVWDAFEILLLANDLAFEKKGEIVNVMTQRDYELLYGERFQDKKQVKVVQLKYAKAADLSRALNQIKTNVGRVVADEGSNTIVLIDAPEKVKEMEDFIQKTDLPLETRVFGLSYAAVDKINTKLQEAITKGVGSIKIDERTNKIAITDYPEKLNQLAQIILAFDEKTPQVLIDAQIIELTPSDQFQMGVNWDYWIKKYFEFKTSLPISSSNVVLTTATSTPTGKGEYKGAIDILRTIGDTKILSSPRIMALNNQEAKILVGTKEAYITSSQSQGSSGQTVTSQTVNFVDVGLKLYVTPTINKDEFITMKIKPEISTAVYKTLQSASETTEVPIVTTSEAETTIMVKDGTTIVIGGLRKDKRTKTVKKIPLIGDMPGLGFLFRSTDDKLEKTDLVILLTPHIMSGEKSYTDFAEIKPQEGAVLSMEAGNIIVDKISASKQDEALNSFQDLSFQDYQQLLINRINQSAKMSSPAKSFTTSKISKSGEVEVDFRVSADGSLISEPVVINTTDPNLIALAIKAVKDASPFPPLPQGLNKKEESFRISLEYK